MCVRALHALSRLVRFTLSKVTDFLDPGLEHVFRLKNEVGGHSSGRGGLAIRKIIDAQGLSSSGS